MIIGCTGHRKLGNYKIPNPIYNYVKIQTIDILKEKKPTKIITGMAIGYDQLVAKIAIKLKIPFIAAIPFVGQELLWPKETREHYQDLLSHAEQIEVISSGAYASWKMHARNKWIVNNSNLIIAAYDEELKIGGTFHCVSYTKEQNKPLIIINPNKYLKNNVV